MYTPRKQPSAPLGILFLIRMAARYTLTKNERLKRRKIIEQLFNERKGIHILPLRASYKWYTGTLDAPLQAGFSVSSRTFKKAVDRNRIKRMMREAYRLQKQELRDQLCARQRQLAVFFIYTGREMPQYHVLHEKMGVILNKLLKQIHEARSADT